MLEIIYKAQRLTGEDKALLIRRDALLVLDLGLHVLDGVGGLHLKYHGLGLQRHRDSYLKSDGLAGKGLHEDLHDDD